MAATADRVSAARQNIGWPRARFLPKMISWNERQLLPAAFECRKTRRLLPLHTGQQRAIYVLSLYISKVVIFERTARLLLAFIIRTAYFDIKSLKHLMPRHMRAPIPPDASSRALCWWELCFLQKGQQSLACLRYLPRACSTAGWAPF